MRLFIIEEDLVTSTEITGITDFQEVSKVMDGGGILACTVWDFEMANYATLAGYLWNKCEVRKNDGTTVLWEGFINHTKHSRNRTYLYGQEAFRVLDDIQARYNAELSSGTVTAIGADYITDANNTFTAAVNGKQCLFTDRDVPANEEVTMNSNSDFYHSGTADNPAEIETGSYNDLPMRIFDTSNKEKDGYGMECKFTLQGTPTNITVDLVLGGYIRSRYGGGDEPLIEIWNQDDLGFKSSDQANEVRGLGRMAIGPSGGIMINASINIYGQVADYLNGGELFIRVRCGETAIGTGIALMSARCRYDYAAHFTAEETVYTIDDYTQDANTTLTFTGQTINASGVAVGDLYRVGNTLDTIAGLIFTWAAIWFLDLDMTATTVADTADYRTEMVLPILMDFASRVGFSIWQEIGWTLNIKNTFAATGLTLTEADFVSTPGDEWNLDRDASDTISRAVVLGGNVEVITVQVIPANNWYTPRTYLEPETRVLDQSLAYIAAGRRMLDWSAPPEVLVGRLDYDKGTDYSAVDVGKAIDINLYSTTYEQTNGIIREVHYSQKAAGHLFNDIVIENPSVS